MTSDDGPAPSAEPSDEESTGDGSSSDRPTVTIGSDGFRPDAADEAVDEVDEDGAVDAADARTTAGLENAIPDASGGFDWRGWLLVGVIAVCFLAIPIAILLRPLRIVGFQTTYLVLPLLPALVLGATAVWVAIRSRQGER